MSLSRWTTLAVACAALAACKDTPTSPSYLASRPSFAVNDGVPNVGEFEVCKAGASGTFNVTYSPVGGAEPMAAAQYTLAAGQCVLVLSTNAGSGTGYNVAVTETTTPLSISVQETGGGNDAVVTANSVTNFVNIFHGTRAVFTNPTPPPTGTEGCSPGYYKKHIQPLASSTFGALGFVGTGQQNVTLQVALTYSGGPTLQDAKNVLLRQAAAAYLNSVRLSGAYPLTTAQVVAGVNAALASNDRQTILDYAATLDGYNNLEGPRC